jgi:hypothetical protein
MSAENLKGVEIRIAKSDTKNGPVFEVEVRVVGE